jgi:hypothetical protein
VAFYHVDERINLDGAPGEARKTLLWEQACDPVHVTHSTKADSQAALTQELR